MLLVHITYVQDTVVIPVFIVRLYFDEMGNYIATYFLLSILYSR